jgi:two-component system nitrate/nitrite response regulator NarL
VSKNLEFRRQNGWLLPLFPEIGRLVVAAVRGRGLVVDDHTYMRRALRDCLIEVGATDVAECSDLAGARAEISRHGVAEIVVLDLRLSDGSALDLLPELAAAGSKAVVFTAADDGYSVRSAYAAGASGYLLKSSSHGTVLAALRSVLDNQIHVEPGIANLLVAGVQHAALGGGQPLTAREIDVLRLAAEGMSNNAIAAQLAVTGLVVKGHFVRIGRKLGAHDRTHMVVAAMRADLLR